MDICCCRWFLNLASTSWLIAFKTEDCCHVTKGWLGAVCLAFQHYHSTRQRGVLFLHNKVFYHDTNWHCCKVHIAALPLKCIFEQQTKQTTNKERKNPRQAANLLKMVQIKLWQFIQKFELCCWHIHWQWFDQMV